WVTCLAPKPDAATNHRNGGTSKTGDGKLRMSPAPRLIGTPRKRTIAAREVDHGSGHERRNAAGRRGATTSPPPRRPDAAAGGRDSARRRRCCDCCVAKIPNWYRAPSV